jgi:hypothetical protein
MTPIDTLPYVSIGSSSFLFLIPFLYCVIKCNRTVPFIYWTITLGFLTITSFLCNHYTECPQFVLCDYSAICALSVIYFLCFSRAAVAGLLCILYVAELLLYGTLSLSSKIAFLMLNLFAFTNFTTVERIIWVIAFAIGIYCKHSRVYTCAITYPIHTTFCHICCSILLVLASRSIIRIAIQ